MRREIQHLRENIERQNMGSKRKHRFASLFVIVFFFDAFIWCLKNGRDCLLQLM